MCGGLKSGIGASGLRIGKTLEVAGWFFLVALALDPCR